jgi:hypothetical protein
VEAQVLSWNCLVGTVAESIQYFIDMNLLKYMYSNCHGADNCLMTDSSMVFPFQKYRINLCYFPFSSLLIHSNITLPCGIGAPYEVMVFTLLCAHRASQWSNKWCDTHRRPWLSFLFHVFTGALQNLQQTNK